MKVTRLPDVEPRARRIAIGEFDGVHLGHREVIGGSDTVLTFDPHPQAVLSPHAAPKLLTSLHRRAEILAEMRVRELVIIPFNRTFAAQSAQAFVDDVLIHQLGVIEVRVGENFRFGHRAQGDVALLRSQVAFATVVAPMVTVDGKVVSSTRIRRLVTQGQIERAGQLLGLPFTLRGIVVRGAGREPALGHPTASLVQDEELCYPGPGFYACRATLGTETWPAAVRVGPSGEVPLIEVHLIGFRGQCYGRQLSLAFLEHVRVEHRDDTRHERVEQLGRAAARALEVAGSGTV